MAYVLIEFDDGGGVAIVRKTWLTPRKREVFWPPIKDQKTFDKILESTRNPDVERWKIYSIVRCLYETDDLDKARTKCKLSEETSDLQTDNQDIDTRKRKKALPSRYISSDEVESDEDLIRPPKLKNTFCGAINNTIDEIAIAAEDPSEIIKEIIFNTENSIISDAITGTSATTSSTDGVADISDIHQNYTLQFATGTTDVTNSTPFQKKVISLLTHIKIQNTQVLGLLQKNKEVLPSHNFAFQFPMKILNDVNSVEEILKQKEQLNNLSTYLSTIGGVDVSSKVSRILQHIFTDSLAAQFSFYGKRLNKRPFSDLRLRYAIVESVKICTPAITNKEIEESIKVWLKHAPDRVKNKIKRNRHNEQNVNPTE